MLYITDEVTPECGGHVWVFIFLFLANERIVRLAGIQVSETDAR